MSRPENKSSEALNPEAMSNLPETKAEIKSAIEQEKQSVDALEKKFNVLKEEYGGKLQQWGIDIESVKEQLAELDMDTKDTDLENAKELIEQARELVKQINSEVHLAMMQEKHADVNGIELLNEEYVEQEYAESIDELAKFAFNQEVTEELINNSDKVNQLKEELGIEDDELLFVLDEIVRESINITAEELKQDYDKAHTGRKIAGSIGRSMLAGMGTSAVVVGSFGATGAGGIVASAMAMGVYKNIDKYLSNKFSLGKHRKEIENNINDSQSDSSKKLHENIMRKIQIRKYEQVLIEEEGKTTPDSVVEQLQQEYIDGKLSKNEFAKKITEERSKAIETKGMKKEEKEKVKQVNHALAVLDATSSELDLERAIALQARQSAEQKSKKQGKEEAKQGKGKIRAMAVEAKSFIQEKILTKQTAKEFGKGAAMGIATRLAYRIPVLAESMAAYGGAAMGMSLGEHAIGKLKFVEKNSKLKHMSKIVGGIAGAVGMGAMTYFGADAHAILSQTRDADGNIDWDDAFSKIGHEMKLDAAENVNVFGARPAEVLQLESSIGIDSRDGFEENELRKIADSMREIPEEEQNRILEFYNKDENFEKNFALAKTVADFESKMSEIQNGGIDTSNGLDEDEAKKAAKFWAAHRKAADEAFSKEEGDENKLSEKEYARKIKELDILHEYYGELDKSEKFIETVEINTRDIPDVVKEFEGIAQINSQDGYTEEELMDAIQNYDDYKAKLIDQISSESDQLKINLLKQELKKAEDAEKYYFGDKENGSDIAVSAQAREMAETFESVNEINEEGGYSEEEYKKINEKIKVFEEREDSDYENPENAARDRAVGRILRSHYEHDEAYKTAKSSFGPSAEEGFEPPAAGEKGAIVSNQNLEALGFEKSESGEYSHKLEGKPLERELGKMVIGRYIETGEGEKPDLTGMERAKTLNISQNLINDLKEGGYLEEQGIAEFNQQEDTVIIKDADKFNARLEEWAKHADEIESTLEKNALAYADNYTDETINEMANASRGKEDQVEIPRLSTEDQAKIDDAEKGVFSGNVEKMEEEGFIVEAKNITDENDGIFEVKYDDKIAEVSVENGEITSMTVGETQINPSDGEHIALEDAKAWITVKMDETQEEPKATKEKVDVVSELKEVGNKLDDAKNLEQSMKIFDGWINKNTPKQVLAYFIKSPHYNNFIDSLTEQGGHNYISYIGDSVEGFWNSTKQAYSDLMDVDKTEPTIKRLNPGDSFIVYNSESEKLMELKRLANKIEVYSVDEKGEPHQELLSKRFWRDQKSFDLDDIKHIREVLNKKK